MQYVVPARKLIELGCTLVFSGRVCATEVLVLEGVCWSCIIFGVLHGLLILGGLCSLDWVLTVAD